MSSDSRITSSNSVYSGPGVSKESPTRSGKWALVACAIGGVAGGIIVILGGMNIFGGTGTIGFAASITAGSALILTAIGGCTVIICKRQVEYTEANKIDMVEPIGEEMPIENPSDKLYIVTDSAYTEHLTGKGHPEQPDRITSINQALEKAHLKDKNNHLPPRLATVSEIALCHELGYIQKAKKEIESLKDLQVTDLSTGDVKISPRSWNAALLAVGGVLTAVDQIFSGKASKAFCIVRPPGHHAGCARGAGFCIFNNVAIAARYAQQKYHIERVLIVDWDVHHGDGTQNIFYKDPSVFYFSTHEAGNYPNTGKVAETGEGEGEGFTMNVPIKGKRLAKREGTGAQVIDAFRHPLTEAMKQFRPELILISCGFDGHKDDPLGGFDLTNEDYATLTSCVNQIAHQYAQGRVVSVLEGGYNLEAIAAASISHVRALMKGV